jgi:hypothetical protein
MVRLGLARACWGLVRSGVVLGEGNHDYRAHEQERYHPFRVAGEIQFEHVVRPFTKVRRATGVKSLAANVREL